MAADGRFWRPVQFDNDRCENPVCGLEASAGHISQESVKKKCVSNTRLHGKITITEDFGKANKECAFSPYKHGKTEDNTRGKNSEKTYLKQQELQGVSLPNTSEKRRHKSDGASLKKQRCRDTLPKTSDGECFGSFHGCWKGLCDVPSPKTGHQNGHFCGGAAIQERNLSSITSQNTITSRKTGHQNDNFFSGAAIQKRKLSSVTSQNMSGGDGRTYCDEKGGDCHGLEDVDACTAATDCHRVQDLSSSAVSQGIAWCHGRDSNGRDSQVRYCNGGDSNGRDSNGGDSHVRDSNGGGSHLRDCHPRNCDGGWLLANYTVVPYVVRDGHQHLSVSVLQYGAGLVDKSLAPYCLQASKAESSCLNQLCLEAGIKFTLNSDTRLISLYVLVQIHPVIAQCVYTIPDNTIHLLLQNLKSIRSY